ncbi:MAG: hypothetical protein ACO3ND_02845 [Opitutales bacterium]
MNSVLLASLTLCLAALVAAEDKPAESQKENPAAKKKAGKKNPVKGASFVPEKVEGVSDEQLAKIREQLPKAYMSPEAEAVRKRLAELKAQSEFASALEKKDMKNDFENASYDLRKALKEVMIAADPAIEKGAVDRVFAEIENINRERAEAARSAKAKAPAKGKTPQKPFPFGDKKPEEKK